MRRLLLVCLSAIGLCLVSCTDKDRIPAGVLPKDKMEQVLWDMIQAERFRETWIRDTALDLKKETFKLYAQVFEVHHITKDEFVKSYKFYMSRPDISRAMFDSMATEANRQREDLYKPKPIDSTKVQKPATDSTKIADSTKTKVTDTTKAAAQVKPAPAAAAAPLPPDSRRRPARINLKRLKGGDTLFKFKPRP